MDRTLDSVPTGDFFSFPEITDPTTVTDEELVRSLNRRAFARANARLQELARLVSPEDLRRLRPEQLPGCFLTRGVFSPKGWQTDHGSWEPMQKKAMSSVGNMMGVKTILEFKPNEGTNVISKKRKGTKVDIGQMALYNRLVPHADGLFMDESVSLCCVFPKGKGPATDPCKGFVAPPLDELDEDIRSNFDASKFCPMDVKDYGVGGRCKRQGWEGYTKIYTIDDDRLYAACNDCTTMLKLKADSGTGSQNHHNKSCLFKKQLLIATSMDTPSIASGNQGPQSGILGPSTA